MPSKLLRNIPSVSDLLENPTLKGLVEKVSQSVVVTSVRKYLDELRSQVKSAAEDLSLPTVGELAEKIASRIRRGERPTLRPVVNATGILLHTGLGRAPLAQEAIDQMVAVARDYASVELDLVSGERSQRVRAVEKLLTGLTGAEAALVVNNNAAATLLTLTALAPNKEVIVSRGQLIEIGGSFRLPDVMTASGALLREVGTTNKTRLSDYRDAIGDQTAAIMRVHTSNFVVLGFTETVSLADLVKLGNERQLPVVDDIGSGALVDFSQFGFADEPQAAASIKAGADLVLFSGDKLLGGPQCGIAVGRKKFVEKLAGHPMMRALRVDKLTLAALAATLRLYRHPEMALRSVPLLSMLSTSLENLENRAKRLAPQVADCPAVLDAEAVEEVTFLGGGSVPTEQLPTWCVAVHPASGSVDSLASALRTGETAVVGRVQQDRFLLDLRTVPPRQDQLLVSAFRALSEEISS